MGWAGHFFLENIILCRGVYLNDFPSIFIQIVDAITYNKIQIVDANTYNKIEMQSNNPEYNPQVNFTLELEKDIKKGKKD